MGKEEEGENLERERESPEMETPVRNQITDTTVSKFEESPVFNFINSLSPLKTVKSLRISQRFNSFSFPSVASVFTSPQVSSAKGAAVLKKHHVSEPSSINSSSENENKVYNSDEQKENYAVNTYEGSRFTAESGQSGPDPMPCDGVQTECLFEGTLRSDGSLAQEPAVIRDDVDNEEKPDGDWEKLIANAGDFLIFDSPSDTDAFRGTSLCKSLMPEFAFENTNELHNKHFVDRNEVEQCETEPPAQLVDNEPFPNLHRGVRRRCLVFEMGGARKKKLEESSSSGPVMLSPYNSEAISIDKQLNDSACCIVPGIGLHLNALAKTSNNNGFGHETHSTNVFISNGSHLSVGPGQDYVDQSLPAASMERDTGAVENGIPGTEDADQASGYIAIVDINHISPKKKRRKMEIDGENEGCKRCNCKKSKCLKLYCECFAAGVYCVEPCSCQECFNKPIHEETVLATRKQIESRNPLAFAPKVIRSSESAPETRDDSSKTPASARHKRGCNCKKSGCLKKYCECYQEGVGCSINCRCEGCKNAFGRKDGSVPGAEAQLEEEEIETREKSMVDKSLHENVFQNSVQETGINCLPATPSRLARASIQLPFSTRELLRSSSLAIGSSSLAIGSSSKLDENQNSENTSFLLPHAEVEERSEAIEGGEMPEILQGNYSSLGLIKSSSPNRKRVSPPHYEFKRSPNRMISRKLILQSIPSFPSLTPK